MPNQAIIFDLDGTLVDSAKGVLLSLHSTFDKACLRPALPFSTKLIGPPLHETLRLLSDNASAAVLDQLRRDFVLHYDAVGYKQTVPFWGVEHMLKSLLSANISLYIATNKRAKPTSKIIDMLGWSAVFELVVSPDSFTPSVPSKGVMLKSLLAEASLDAKNCLYIGDRIDDYHASLESGIPFVLAEWGFEGDGPALAPDTIRLKLPDAGQLIASFTDRDSFSCLGS